MLLFREMKEYQKSRNAQVQNPKGSVKTPPSRRKATKFDTLEAEEEYMESFLVCVFFTLSFHTRKLQKVKDFPKIRIPWQYKQSQGSILQGVPQHGGQLRLRDPSGDLHSSGLTCLGYFPPHAFRFQHPCYSTHDWHASKAELSWRKPQKNPQRTKGNQEQC